MFRLEIPDNVIVKAIDFPRKIFGASMKKGDIWCVGVHSSLNEFEKERMVAHEIGHCIDDTCGKEGKFYEQCAEEIACEMLVPKGKLRKVIEDGWQTIDEIRLFFPSATPDMIERSCRCIYS